MRVFRFSTVHPGARAFGVLGVALLSMTGCATLGTLQGGVAGGGSPPAIAARDTPDASSALPPPFPLASQDNDTLPGLIIPATGGPPVLGIPVGGGMFLPATGGPPVIGISVEP